jgi:dihydrofolate reductase
MGSGKVSIIVAMDEKRGIGKNQDLLFRIPEDGKRVREVTDGHPLVMGRKTFESLGRLLPNRTHIVVTRDPTSLKHLSYQPHDAVSSVADGIYEAQEEPGADEIFIFGGGQIYKEALEQGLVDKLYLTIVEGDYGADTFFPEYENLGFKVVKEESREADGYRYKFVDLEK